MSSDAEARPQLTRYTFWNGMEARAEGGFYHVEEVDAVIARLVAQLAETEAKRAEQHMRACDEVGMNMHHVKRIEGLETAIDTLRAEVETVRKERDAANTRLDRILNEVVPEHFRPVSFAALCDGIDSKQLETDVYSLLIWHLRHSDKLQDERDDMEQRLAASESLLSEEQADNVKIGVERDALAQRLMALEIQK